MGTILVSRERSPEHRIDAQHFEEIERHGAAQDVVGVVAARQVQPLAGAIGGERLK